MFVAGIQNIVKQKDRKRKAHCHQNIRYPVLTRHRKVCDNVIEYLVLHSFARNPPATTKTTTKAQFKRQTFYVPNQMQISLKKAHEKFDV